MGQFHAVRRAQDRHRHENGEGRNVDIAQCEGRTIRRGPTLSMYYKTPDNGNVELQIDCFESAEACMEWFKSGPYDENPIGIKVDIEELFERYRNGEPLQSLLKRRRLRDGESFMEHVVM